MKKIFTILSVVALTTVNAQELLTNPSFENGLAPWAAGTATNYTAPTIATDGGQSGANYATYGTPSATTGFYQNVPVTEGKTYVISFWYKAGTDNSTRLWSVYKNSAGAAVYTTANASTDSFRTNNGYFAPATEWTFYSAEMPAGTGATSLDVAVRAYRTGLSSFDSFSVYEKGTMSVADVKTLENTVKFNTVVDDVLRVQTSEKVTLNVYSAEGKLVSSNRVSNNDTVNMQGLVKGVYIVVVDNGAAKFSKKVVKK